jgi:hypothetical protein
LAVVVDALIRFDAVLSLAARCSAWLDGRRQLVNGMITPILR